MGNREDALTHAAGLPGWMLPEELAWLYDQAASMGSVAELGCWKGRSTYALASACPGTVYAIDHWRGTPDERNGAHAEARDRDIIVDFRRNLRRLSNVVMIVDDTAHAASYLPDVDMVFIDAGHEEADVQADLCAWATKANRLLCGHDRYEPGVATTLEHWADVYGGVKHGPGTIWYFDRQDWLTGPSAIG